jgi:hypothetical protein
MPWCIGNVGEARVLQHRTVVGGITAGSRAESNLELLS